MLGEWLSAFPGRIWQSAFRQVSQPRAARKKERDLGGDEAIKMHVKPLMVLILKDEVRKIKVIKISANKRSEMNGTGNLLPLRFGSITFLSFQFMVIFFFL